VTTDWASNNVTDYRTVAKVVRGKAKMIATCAIGYAATKEPCPGWDDTSEDDGWNMTPAVTDKTPELQPAKRSRVWTYDPDDEMDPSTDEWLKSCLTDPNYPPPAERKK
jgi:hypothetical protein